MVAREKFLTSENQNEKNKKVENHGAFHMRTGLEHGVAGVYF